MILAGKHGRRVTRHPYVWRPFVTIPQAANKTYGSRAVSTLTAFDGRLWIGYGDWGSNNGPTDVISVGPEGDIKVHLKDVPTEALTVYRKAPDGSLWSPYIDPKWYWGDGGLVTNYGGSWHIISPPDMVHCFDVAINDRGLWVAGSRLDPVNPDISHPVVVLSEDVGKTWKTVLWDERASAGARIYELTEVGKEVWCRDDRGVFRSTTSGDTWITVSGPWPGKYPTATVALGDWEYRGEVDGTISRRIKLRRTTP